MHCYVRILINSCKDKYPIFKQGATKKAGQLSGVLIELNNNNNNNMHGV